MSGKGRRGRRVAAPGGRKKDGRAAVLLLSGGLDSATAGAWARRRGFELYALTIRYGQTHAVETTAARRVARFLEVREHLVLKVDLARFGGSALTDPSRPVPKDRAARRIGCDIPATYVPARNTVFLSLALSLAEARGATDLVIGANVTDYSGYPDCRPEFLRAFERTAARGTKAGVEGQRFKIHAPLLHKSKAKIIRLGLDLGLDYGITHSCYDPVVVRRSIVGGRGRRTVLACGRCDSCRLRRRGFAAAGVSDPLPYADRRG